MTNFEQKVKKMKKIIWKSPLKKEERHKPIQGYKRNLSEAIQKCPEYISTLIDEFYNLNEAFKRLELAIKNVCKETGMSPEEVTKLLEHKEEVEEALPKEYGGKWKKSA